MARSKFLGTLSKSATDARAVVLPHVAPGRELAETTRRLELRLPDAAGSDEGA
jgi:hypothetical protein